MAWFGFYEASSFSAAGLYEWTQPVINNDFNLYYGVGGHLGAAANKFDIGIDAVTRMQEFESRLSLSRWITNLRSTL